ncbi:DUF1631 family protein [uncultured Pseudacidovorax sp.]|uniref:DUF1631 family protein n=1 Tax=uncultured Pseudacidovorax sp. TaxID=679313 RepID=UPI0025E363C2|nr:DUF1631 family protein [uncultured Pseudacidovorax sp.]
MSPSLPRESALLLARESRERFVHAIDGALPRTVQAVRDRLLALAGEVGTARKMQENRDHLLAWEADQVRWLEAVRQRWTQALSQTRVAGTSTTGALRLELVGDEVVENSILVSRLAMSLQDRSPFELNELKLRIQYLEGSSGADWTTGDVLRPETLASILVEEWTSTGLPRTLWAQVQDILSGHLGDAATKGYQDLNAFLIGRGVMPEIELRSLVRRGADSAPSPLGPAGGPSTDRGSASGPWDRTRPQTAAAQVPAPSGGAIASARQQASAVLGRLRRIIGGVVTNGGNNAPGASAPPTGTGSHSGFAPDAGWQRGSGGSSGGYGARGPGGGGGGGPGGAVDGGYGAPAGSAPIGIMGGDRRGWASNTGSEAFTAAIADVEAAYPFNVGVYVNVADPALMQRAQNDLRRQSGELKRRAPTSADKATVEVVALMFQSILAEERIPFSVRVWFARLQMPVLRVAVADAEFFATLQHPARMLIDRMGSVVMGFDAAAISGSALEGEIRRVVQVIEQYPETGQRVFKLVYDEFVAFLSKYLTQNDATQKVMSVAQQVEQKETLAIQYTIELRKMLNDMPVREEIREFLFKVWAEVLAIGALKYGAQDEQTAQLRRVASELVWAASAKPSRSERARMIQALPSLLQRLRQGMDLMGLTGQPQEDHIKTLGRTLSDAFTAKTESIPVAQIENLAGRLANLEAVIGDESAEPLALDSTNLELLLGIDVSSMEVLPNNGAEAPPEALEWANALQIGAWFLLDHNGRPSQVQFVWRSKHRQLHLFGSPDGRQFLIQAQRLAAYLHGGLLVPAEEETLTVRATREALAKIDANPERLLS